MANDNLLTGVWDIHVHTTPSLFERKSEFDELISDCLAKNMAGVILKSHHGSSVEIAYALNKQSSNLHVFGGVVLNHFVGGLNPYAVDSAIALGAKIIWLPTMHAISHELCHCEKNYKKRQSNLKLENKHPISCLDSTGYLLPEMIAILNLLNNRQTVLASGHISFDEIKAIIDYIDINKLKIKFLINHVFYKVPNLNLQQLKHCQKDWVYFEVAFLCVSPAYACMAEKTLANIIKKLPEANWIMSSDSGQFKNPSTVESMQKFIELMQVNMVSNELIRKATIINPARLLC